MNDLVDQLRRIKLLTEAADEIERLRSEIERLRGQEGGALAPELNPNAVSEAYRLWVQDTHEGDDQPRWVRISDVGLVDMVYAAFKAGALAPGLGASPSGLDPADVRDEIAEFLFDAFDPEGAVESPHGPYIWDDMSDAYQSKYTACADEILQLAEPVRSTAPTPPVQTPKTQVTDEQVERAARALYITAYKNSNCDIAPEAKYVDMHASELFSKHARAALEAALSGGEV